MKKYKNIPVIIFCGGTGTNIRGFFEPKACIPVNGMPLLYHIIKKYLESGFSKFILLVGLGAEKISDLISKDNLNLYLGSKSADISLTIVFTGGSNGTGSRLLQCYDYIKDYEEIAISYSDTISDVDLIDAYTSFSKSGYLMQLTAVNQPTRFKVLGFSIFEDYIRGISPNPILDSNYIAGGYYYVKKEFISKQLKKIDNFNLSFEDDMMPEGIAGKQVKYYKHDSYWYFIDSLRDIQTIENKIGSK